MSDFDPLAHNDPARKDILNLYAIFAVSLVFSAFPNMICALLSLAFLVTVMIEAGRLRRKYGTGSLGENHGTYILRTIWIGGALAAVTLIVGSIYMLMTIKTGPLLYCMEQMVNNPVMDVNAVSAMLKPCIDNFIKLNLRALIVSGVITITPVALYFIVRVLRGGSRAFKGYRLADPKTWF